MTDADPLEALLVDHRAIDRKALASILKNRVGVDPESEQVILYSEAREERTIAEQALFCLLGQRVLNLFRSELPDGLSPSELSQETGIKGGSLRPALARLADDGLVVKREGRYTVPSHALGMIRERLGGSDE